MVDVKDILNRYGNRIEEQIGGVKIGGKDYSREYTKFKQEMAPDLSRYEKWCKSLGSVIKLKVSEKDESEIKKYLKIAHLDLEPWQALTLSVMAFLAAFLIGVLISVAITLIGGGLAAFPFLFFILVIIASLFLFYFVNGYPKRLASKWRLKASSQMVPAILYAVVYMRHTPNLENAIEFAAENLEYPLALDFKKVFYDVQIGKFSSIKESLDNYLKSWIDYSPEFVEAFHLIEASLYEPEHSRRIATLEKSLQVVLDGVYDKMLKFSHEVRSPLTNVYMLGVVLPTLGLALLPLASAMLGGMLGVVHVFVLFNLIIPFLVFYLTDKVTYLRPGGYGETTLLSKNPYYSKYKSSAPYFSAFIVCFPLFLIGIVPLLFGYTGLPFVLGLERDFSFESLGLGFLGEEGFFGFIETSSGVVGPFGIGGLVLSMFVPLSIALFFMLSYKQKTKDLILERKRTKELEDEFNSSLFQLGNRVGGGVPPELVFSKVAESSRGLRIEDFFRRINFNIRQAGMSVEKAIFDRNRGAINSYPSDLIATSMKIFIEAVKKGLKIAAVSLISISEYVKNIKKITNRLKDMLAEIVSDMKSNMTFLAPLLSGVVVGLALMISSILGRLNFANLAGEDLGVGNLDTILNIFDITAMIPPYYLQICIGIYLIQIIFILTRTLVTIDSGQDRLEEMNKTGKNLSRGILIYLVVALLSTIALFILTAVVLGGIF